MRLGHEIRLILVEPEEIEVDEAVVEARLAEQEAYRAEVTKRQQAAVARLEDGLRRRFEQIRRTDPL